MSQSFTWLEGPVLRGHGIASGARGCQELGGSIHAQKPFFRAAGIELGHLHDGTLNVGISPRSFTPVSPAFTITGMKWHPEWPAETFFLFDARIRHGGEEFSGYVYYPDPGTKPSAFLGHDMLEILAPYLSGIGYGDRLDIGIDPSQMDIR
jgi:hypothetical protein